MRGGSKQVDAVRDPSVPPLCITTNTYTYTAPASSLSMCSIWRSSSSPICSRRNDIADDSSAAEICGREQQEQQRARVWGVG